ncbi:MULTISPECIES: hypothetical protein, partial [Robiginitalea]
ELAQKSGETEKANGGDSRRKGFTLQQAHPHGPLSNEVRKQSRPKDRLPKKRLSLLKRAEKRKKPTAAIAGGRVLLYSRPTPMGRFRTK